MRAKSVLGVVLCFGLAFALLSGSGIGAAVFGAAPGDADTARTLDDVGEQASVDEDTENSGLAGDVTGDNEPTIVGLAISAGSFVTELVVAVGLLPVALMRLGFPQYFAVPVGSIAQVIAFVGLAQFVTGRELI